MMPEKTRRSVEPYGLVGWKGHWYLVAYCCLRKDFVRFAWIGRARYDFWKRHLCGMKHLIGRRMSTSGW